MVVVVATVLQVIYFCFVRKKHWDLKNSLYFSQRILRLISCSPYASFPKAEWVPWQTVGQIPQKCKETSNLMWLSLIWFILVLFVCWNLFWTIANLRIKCVIETKNVSVLFYKSLKSSFSTWLTYLTLRFLYILGGSGPRWGACISCRYTLHNRVKLVLKSFLHFFVPKKRFVWISKPLNKILLWEIFR